MKNLIIRLFFIIIFGGLLFSYAFPWSAYNIDVPFSGADYKLGLDLQGGIELDYKVDLEEVSKEEDYNKQKEKDIIEGLKSIIDKRIETLNINDSVITSANYGSEQHIIVQIPLKGNNSLENSANIERAKQAIGRVVKIEFKESRNEITSEDIKAREDLANKAHLEVSHSEYDFFVTAYKYRDSFENIEVGTMSGTLDKLNEYFTFEKDVKIGLIPNILAGKGKTSLSFENGNIETIEGEKGYWVVDIVSNEEVSADTLDKTSELQKIITFNYIFITQKPSEWMPAQDSKGRILNDKYFTKSSVQFNEAFQPQIELTFNSEGAEIFGELTRRLVGQQIAIFVGGENLTAPTVNEAILSGRAVITGNYTTVEANALAQNINTGVVPAPIYLTSEKSIDSKLGANSLEKLIVAGVSGFLIIFLFLIFIYRMSGFMASISLLLYVIIILVIIKSLGVTLTLASIAGLILSIGIAIDANILIFERVRDEIKSGKDLDDATRIGFKKSWSAIWDSNVTGFIVALVLFIFGINLIKGFGLMLIIGIVVSLFSCYFISRVLMFLLSKTSKNSKIFIGK